MTSADLARRAILAPARASPSREATPASPARAATPAAATPGTSPTCVSCHQKDYAATTNPNHAAGGFPTTCENCHSDQRLAAGHVRPQPDRFPLTGAHTQRGLRAGATSAAATRGRPPTATRATRRTTRGTTNPNHAASGFPTQCQSCHNTSAWKPANFDHNSTRFPLTGAHTRVDCAKCHVGGRYAGTPTDCYSCHQANYAATTNPNHAASGFPTQCQACHNTTAWRPASFNHNSTRFPLTGAHTRADCARCHAGGRYTGTPTDCYSCHQANYAATTNPNHRAASFPTQCQTCHTTSAWKPATFDHDGRYFPIYSGTHRGRWSSCSECHVNPGNYKAFECILCHEHSNKAGRRQQAPRRQGLRLRERLLLPVPPQRTRGRLRAPAPKAVGRVTMRLTALVTLLFIFTLRSVAPARADEGFNVTSRALASVYLDGGRAQGLALGDRLHVVKGQTPVAELEVVSVAEQWSSCRVVSQTRPVGTGDRAVRRPDAVVTRSAPAARAAPAVTPARRDVAPSVASSGPPVSSASSAPAAETPMAAAPTVAPETRPAPASSRFIVKYRSAANVYLDGGRAQGLAVGDRLKVVADATTVAELEVVYAAEQSASCTVFSETRPVHSGDIALLLARAPSASAPATAAPPAAPEPAAAGAAADDAAPSGAPASRRANAAPWARVRGSASFGIYRTWDQTESGYDFQERTARLDLGVYDIAGQPLSFTLRGRSRQDVRDRTLSERTPSSERTDRLYEVALRYEPPSDNLGVEVGRIGIYRFVGIGYLDGVLARARPLSRLEVGGFAGRIADIETLGFGGTGGKLGGFVRLSPGGRYAMGTYDATLAFVRENADGDVSREYLSLESRFAGGHRWTVFQRAELDLNRGWRHEITGKSYQFSNVSLSGNLRVATSAWAFVSYDGRRNYRYYRNRIVPEEVFDDLLHQGLRAGLNFTRPGGFGGTAGFGMTSEGAGPAQSGARGRERLLVQCGRSRRERLRVRATRSGSTARASRTATRTAGSSPRAWDGASRPVTCSTSRTAGRSIA